MQNDFIRLLERILPARHGQAKEKKFGVGWRQLITVASCRTRI
jgi:hypothetical protein